MVPAMEASPSSSACDGLAGSGLAAMMPRTVKSWSVGGRRRRASMVLGSISAAAPTPSQAVRSWDRDSWPLERTSFIRLSVACSVLLL